MALSANDQLGAAMPVLVILLQVAFLACLGSPALAHDPGTEPSQAGPIKNRQHAVELIEAYLELPAPHPEALSALLADETVRDFGVHATLAMLSRPLLEMRLRPRASRPEPLNPADSIKLFNILEALVKDAPARRQDSSGTRLINELQSSDGIMSQGLAQMVEIGCAGEDPVLARFYYRRLNDYPRRASFDFDRANAALALVKLYCRQGRTDEAEWIYVDFKSLNRRSGITLRQGQAALTLIEALAAQGEPVRARHYYEELDRLTGEKYLKDYKAKARQALNELK